MATNPYGPQTGLLGLLGAGQNPIYRSLKDGGLLDSLAYGLASGTGLSDGLQKAALAQIGGQNNRQERAAKAAEWDQTQQQQNATRELLAREAPDLAQLLDTGVPMGEVWGEYFRRKSPQGSGELPNSVQEYEYAKANGFGGSYTDWLSGKGGATERSLTPTYLRDENGNIVIGQLDKGGQVTPSKLPDGYSAIDPFTMAGGKTGATVDAKTAGAARAALPGAEVSYSNTQKAIAELRGNAAGMNEWFGQIGPRGVYINPGSEMGKFWAAAEPTNNQAFMQARESLKGGGQITDFEGRKAEDAFSRMRASLEKGDQEQYLRALADFEDAVAQGYAKLRETAQGGYGATSPNVTGGAPDPVSAADALLNSGKY
jgi:hypothetical protein